MSILEREKNKKLENIWWMKERKFKRQKQMSREEKGRGEMRRGKDWKELIFQRSTSSQDQSSISTLHSLCDHIHKILFLLISLPLSLSLPVPLSLSYSLLRLSLPLLLSLCPSLSLFLSIIIYKSSHNKVHVCGLTCGWEIESMWRRLQHQRNPPSKQS